MELWVSYNTTSGQVLVVKGRRMGERVSATANKLNKLINNKQIVVCDLACSFFKDHHIDKNKIEFCWDITIEEKMNLFRHWFKRKEYSY